MAVTRQTGKLVVILHADVVQSTKLVQLDERVAHERIQQTFQRFGETISRYGGCVREVRGDALLAEFDRASDAVSATVAFLPMQQTYLCQFNDGILPEVRVGIALGEVIVADNTITGAGVVMAQRVEQLAEAGGVCITSAIYETLPKRMPFETVNLGEQSLKGFEEPVRVYRVGLAQGAAVPSPDSPSEQGGLSRPRIRVGLVAGLALIVIAGLTLWLQPWQSSKETTAVNSSSQFAPTRPSIAVLPFNNMSGDPGQEYFADGISEDLTTDLSKLSGLFVVARNSSFAYRDKSMDLRDVARELGVRYLLEGSIRRQGEQVRINAQLIDGSTGGHVWAERFDGGMSNIFDLQDEVNRKIVEALAINLTLNERKQLEQVETTNPQAYDLLLRGLEQFHLSSPESTLEARNFFQEAIKLDPGYARAYANIALTHASDVNFLRTADKQQSIRLGLEFAEQAIKLDSSIPQIFFTRSALYLAQRKYEASIEAARRMIEVHPNYADGHGMLAFALCFGGQHAEALLAIRSSRRIDPEVSYLDLAIEGRILFHLEQYTEAVALIEQSVLKNPAYDRTQLMLAAAYAQLGRLEDASWAIEEALLIKPQISLDYERKEGNYKREQDLELYLNALRKAGLPET